MQTKEVSKMQFHNFPLINEIYFPYDHKRWCLSFVLIFELNISSQKSTVLASIFEESIGIWVILYLVQKNKDVAYI